MLLLYIPAFYEHNLASSKIQCALLYQPSEFPLSYDGKKIAVVKFTSTAYSKYTTAKNAAVLSYFDAKFEKIKYKSINLFYSIKKTLAKLWRDKVLFLDSFNFIAKMTGRKQ